MSKAIAQERPVGASFARHPKGLAILFFTEMWERFTYYGMRSVLILFLVGAVTEGALGLDDRTASSIYGLYISGTYVLALLGGWIADRLIGPQRAVIGGATIIILGNILLTLGRPDLFYVGLLVIVCGVGLLKPNISVMVGQLYPEGGSRRDSGFSIFYMGISVGALLGSLLVPLCVLYYGWSAAFSLGAVGMAIGLCYFLLRRDRLPLAEPVQAVPGRTRPGRRSSCFLRRSRWSSGWRWGRAADRRQCGGDLVLRRDRGVGARLFPLPAAVRRPGRRGEAAGAGDDRAVCVLRHILCRLRTGRGVAQPLRGTLY